MRLLRWLPRQLPTHALPAAMRQPLTGIPMAHKDIFCTQGMTTSCGSRMLDNFVPPYDATVIERFRSAGAIILGKTNMDEFAMGSSNESSYYGAARNPWNTELRSRRLVWWVRRSGGRTAGAGSHRHGHRGLDSPAGGLLRHYRTEAHLWPSIPPGHGCLRLQPGSGWADGPHRRRLRPAAEHHGRSRPTGFHLLRCAREDYTAGLEKSLEGLRIGLPEDYFGEGLDSATGECIHLALKELEALGATLAEVSLPHSELTIPTYYIVAPAEASTNLSRFDGVRYGHRCADPADLHDLYTRTREEGFGDEVKRRILVGTYALSAGYYDAYYKKAQQARRLIQQDFLDCFEQRRYHSGPHHARTCLCAGRQG